MKNIGYYNGKIAPLEEMTVPMNDRGCYFGDGVYETILVVKNQPEYIEEHLDRFYQSAEMMMISVPFLRNELKRILLSTAEKSEYKIKLLYWQITRGTALRTHTFPDTPANLWITVTEGSLPDFHRQLRLITVEDRRYLYCNIKTLNLIPNILASETARQSGCDEAVFVRDGYVTECSHSNIHILQKGILYTAPADHQILAGIARQNLFDACNQLHIPVLQKPFSCDQMMCADEIIITSTTKICQTAAEINGIAVGGRDQKTIKQLQELLRISL